MPAFHAPSVWLETPEGWQDASAYILTGPALVGFKTNVVVSMSRDVLDPYLKRHVDIQAGEMQKTLPGFTLISRSEVARVDFGDTATMEFEWTSAEAGARLHQYQLYVLSNQTLYTVTATAPSAHWHQVEQTLMRVVHSVRPKIWPVAPTV
jgi:hypothetical protein